MATRPTASAMDRTRRRTISSEGLLLLRLVLVLVVLALLILVLLLK